MASVDPDAIRVVIAGLLVLAGKLTVMARAAGATDEQLLALDDRLFEAIERRTTELLAGTPQ